VTIGDFGAQALIIAAIKKNFPDDEVVGEEEASDLRSNKELSSKIWNLVKDIKLSDSEADALVGGPLKSEDVRSLFSLFMNPAESDFSLHGLTIE